MMTIPVPHIGGPLDGVRDREVTADGVPTSCPIYYYVHEETSGSAEPLVSSRWGRYLKTRDGAGWRFLWMQGTGPAPTLGAVIA